MAYKLRADEKLTDSVRRNAHDQLQKALKELRDGIHADPVGSVHAARKAIKKERALLRLARPTMKSAERRSENATLRDAGRRLSAMRDAEVMLQAFDALAERFTGQLPEASFRAVREQLERGRASEHQRAAQSEAVAEAIHALDGVERRVDEWSFTREGWRAIEAGLERSYRQGRAAMRTARRKPTLENLHDWRKRIKDLWYDARLLSEVGGPTLSGYAEEAKQLSELLGDDHDLGVLGQTISATADQVPVDVGPLLHLIDHRRDQLQAEAEVVGERLYAEPPRAFVRRTRRYWKAGRKAAQPISRRRPNTRANASSSP